MVKPAGLDDDLDCFGPFGFSLDHGDDQAAVNATGFVVYPPAGTPPHFNLFVNFIRRLDVPSGGSSAIIDSPPSDAVPLYTLPDSKALLPSGPPLSIPSLSISVSKDGSQRVAPNALRTAPFGGATGAVMQQYRYLLILGCKVEDGGRGTEVFLPQAAQWIEGGALRPLGQGSGTGFTAGVVAEILLNGRPSEKYSDPLLLATNLRNLFSMLFDSSGNDAPGAIRRVSPVFDVTFVETM